MKLLFIGGTAIISTAFTALAVQRGVQLTLLTRGQKSLPELPPGVKIVIADANASALIDKLRQESLDAVVDWIAYTPGTLISAYEKGMSEAASRFS
jgi:hypothetical protein